MKGSRWNKPSYENKRIGFEVTGYAFNRPNFQHSAKPYRIMAMVLSMVAGPVSNASSTEEHRSYEKRKARLSTHAAWVFGLMAGLSQGAWAGNDPGLDAAYGLSGFDEKNTSNTSSATSINRSNVNKLKLKWIYNLDRIPVGSTNPPNPVDNFRGNNYATSGVATDLAGRVYLHLGDGRMITVDSNQIAGVNPDGTPAPKLLSTIDLFSDPKYQGPPEGVQANPSNPERYDVYTTRMHPSMSGLAVYAGNWSNDGAKSSSGVWGDKLTSVPNPSNPNYRREGGAILYKINRFTGNLMWKTVVDDDPRAMISMGSVSTPSLLHPLIFVPFGNMQTGHLLNFDLYDPLLPVFQQLTPVYANDDFGGRGGLAAINKLTGKVVWKLYSLPQQTNVPIAEVIAHGSRNQWAGASSWGAGAPPISTKNNLVYFGTAEASSSTDAAEACEKARLANPAEPLFSEACIDFDQNGNRISGPLSSIVESSADGTTVRSPTHPLPSSVIAVEASTGKVKWARRVSGLDSWNASCFELALNDTFNGIVNLPPIVPGLPVGGVVGFQNYTRLPSGFAPGSYAGPNQDPFCPRSVRDDNLKLQAGSLVPNDYRALNWSSKDLDVAEQPMLVENVKMANGQRRDVVIGTSKSATVFAFDAVTGASLWSQRFGPGSLIGDGFIFGSATDGVKFYSNTGRSSNVTLADLSDVNASTPNLSKTKKVVINSCPVSGFNLAGNWTGGMYVAVDIASGKIAWQRCVTAKPIHPDTKLATGQIVPGRSQAPVSVANGIVIAPGASTYDPTGSGGQLAPADFPLAEVLLLNSDNGELLRTLPLQVDGQPSANTLVFQRPVAIGNRIYMTNGDRTRGPHGIDNDNDLRNRIVMYELAP